MSSKVETAASATADAAPELPGLGVIELQGRDAGAFAQAQLMNDVRTLGDGQWQWTGWLNPKGRVLALGALLRHDESRYWLLLPDHPAGALADALRGFVFRSKVTLTVRADLVARGLWCAPDALADEVRRERFGCVGEIAVLDWSGERPRTLAIGTSPGLDHALTRDDLPPATATGWAAEDLAHGLPRLDAAHVGTHTPQMLGLDRINAYSVRKGCYPGQEIVARTHFLGQAKRGLQRLRGDAPLVAGESLVLEGKVVGDVLCAASDGDRHEALAVLPLDLGSSALSCPDSGTTATMIEFAQGLAR